MKRLLFLLTFFHVFVISGQCDLAITDVNLNTYEVTVEVINGEGCGATGYNGSNDHVNMVMIGFHIPGQNEAVDVDDDGPCFMAPTSNHPGWWYGPSASDFPSNYASSEFPLYTGDTFVVELDNPSNGNCDGSPAIGCCAAPVIDYWLDQGECVEFVIWQINYSNSWYQNDGPNAPGGGWAELGANDDGQQPLSNVQIYPDMDCDNSWSVCREDNPGPAMIQGEDFICETVVIPGCTDPDALNYEPNATEDDGSCVYPPEGSTDAQVAGNVEFITGCDASGNPYYQVQFTITNSGDIDMNTYCVELWHPDATFCYDSGDSMILQIPPGEGQTFNTGQFVFPEGWSEGGLFVIEVNTVNDEIVTGNNTTVVNLPPVPLCEPEVGCTDICAINFDPNAEEDDGSCEYETITITDTVYVNIIDTVEVEVPVFITDTVYIDVIDTVEVEVPVFITDTLYVTEYDTTFIDVVEYVYLTDTITEFIPVDCETGMPCVDDPGMQECWPWTVFIPNTFTPNNDGINDVWKMIYDLNCWVDVEFRVFNRWGSEIYHGYGDDFDSYPYWNGSVNNGTSYVSDGVYTYTFYARKWNSPEVYQRTGHITIFR
jgi:gliding motility-associated-like protein